MSKLKIIILIVIILLLLFTYYLFVNPVLFWVEVQKFWAVPNQANLTNHVKYLTSFSKNRSHKNVKILNEIAFYIYDNFENSNCDKIILQTYEVASVEYKNVICRFNWKNPEKIIIWAHYDVYANYSLDSNNKEFTFPWADSNASGVAWVLELARLVWKNKWKLNNSIEFVAYTLEEQPFFATTNMWSYIHAKSLFEKQEGVKYMISLDSIWYFTDEKTQEYPYNFMKLFYPNKWDFIAVIGSLFDFNIRNLKIKMLNNSDVPVRSLNVPIFIKWVDSSDHRNYWMFWYKAYLITDTAAYRNPNYHTKDDVFFKLNFIKMKEVVKWIYWLLTK